MRVTGHRAIIGECLPPELPDHFRPRLTAAQQGGCFTCRYVGPQIGHGDRRPATAVRESGHIPGGDSGDRVLQLGMRTGSDDDMYTGSASFGEHDGL